MKRYKPATPEGLVKQAVTDLLDAERIWWMRVQTGMQVLEHNGKKRVFRAGRKGMADLLAILRRDRCPGCGRVPSAPMFPGSGKSSCCGRHFDDDLTPIWIECKAPKGKQSPAQMAFQSEVEREGHTYLLVNDVAVVQDWLRRNR